MEEDIALEKNLLLQTYYRIAETDVENTVESSKDPIITFFSREDEKRKPKRNPRLSALYDNPIHWRKYSDNNDTSFIGVQLYFRRVFSEIRGFIVKNWLYIYDSKYCPSLAITFSHLSSSVRIPRRKNWSSFEAIHESIQFFTSS